MTLRAKPAKTNRAFSHTLSTADALDFFGGAFINTTAIASIKDKNDVLLCQFPVQTLQTNQGEITFTCPANDTIDWPVSEDKLRMDVVFSNGTEEGVFSSETIYIPVEKGITFGADALPHEDAGGFAGGFGDGFNKDAV